MRRWGLIIIMALAGVLLSEGVALAHASARDERTSAHHAGLVEADDPTPGHPAECYRRTNVMSSEMLFEGHLATGWRGASDDRKAFDDTDSDADCCGGTCHSAVGSKGNDRPALHLPSGPGVLAITSVLLGTGQGRLERPPRRA
jgi:hypothetical protein